MVQHSPLLLGAVPGGQPPAKPCVVQPVLLSEPHTYLHCDGSHTYLSQVVGGVGAGDGHTQAVCA